MPTRIKQIMQTAPVVPVMVIDSIEQAVPMAEALVEGGLSVLEITLRTPIALQAIRAIKQAVPTAIVGAGTVINPETLDKALEAGAEFIVSPGSTPLLIDAAQRADAALLPGVNTPSEVMALLDRGITEMKFFPAEAAGGVPMLKSIAGPLPQVTFCPTGGINPSNAKQYLALSNVACVGGSWMLPTSLVKQGNWAAIQEMAVEATTLND